MPTVLFLCTGNYYRSRFAEHLFNARAQALNLDWMAQSRGLAIEFGINNIGPIAPATVDGLAARGITLDLPIRAPLHVQHDDFAAAQRIIALYAREHRPLMIERFPAWVGHVEYWNVPDIGEADVATALTAIEREVTGLLRQLQE